MFKKKKKLHIHLITNDRSIFDTSSTIACLLFSLTHILFRRTYLIAFMETPRWMEGRKGGRDEWRNELITFRGGAWCNWLGR